MRHSQLYQFIHTLGLLSILFAAGAVRAETAMADVALGQPAVVTAAPKSAEGDSVPSGYINCFMVPAGWNYKNIWAVEHKVCQYTPIGGALIQGIGWVQGYWACTLYRNGATPKQRKCIKWEWQSSRWVKTLDVY